MPFLNLVCIDIYIYYECNQDQTNKEIESTDLCTTFHLRAESALNERLPSKVESIIPGTSCWWPLS